jgi:hypothetical protein
MEKFAKLFEDTKCGQILVMLQESDDKDGPEIRYYFKPEGMGVCNCTINYKDSETAWDSAEERFKRIKKEDVVIMVANIIKEFEGE